MLEHGEHFVLFGLAALTLALFLCGGFGDDLNVGGLGSGISLGRAWLVKGRWVPAVVICESRIVGIGELEVDF